MRNQETLESGGRDTESSITDVTLGKVVSRETGCDAAARLGGRRGVLRHGLGALRHGVLGELTREDEAHGRLDLARRQRAALVVANEAAGLRRDAVEDVVHERVHD